MTTKLCDEIEWYYQRHNLIRPSKWDAFTQLVVHIGKAAGEINQFISGYKTGFENANVRQSDDEHIRAIGEALGDVIMAAVMAGRTFGIDPIASLKDKMDRTEAGK